jgi:NADH-quinone oxidoreductase subunit E
MSKTDLITQDSKTQIDTWLAKYPKEQARSAIVSTLLILQEQNGGFLTEELMTAAAKYIGILPIEAYEVASFYDMYEFKFSGKHKIAVCTNASCMLRGSEAIVSHLEQRLECKMGQSSSDGQFFLREVECLGACANAPVCQVNNEHYHEDLTVEKVDQLLDSLAKEDDHG